MLCWCVWVCTCVCVKGAGSGEGGMLTPSSNTYRTNHLPTITTTTATTTVPKHPVAFHVTTPGLCVLVSRIVLRTSVPALEHFLQETSAPSAAGQTSSERTGTWPSAQSATQCSRPVSRSPSYCFISRSLAPLLLSLLS
jgi:hypothetical protein